jgi:hypothetical protein
MAMFVGAPARLLAATLGIGAASLRQRCLILKAKNLIEHRRDGWVVTSVAVWRELSEALL